MNIEILSMQRVVNYGSFLQAYSLKCLLESWGNEVNFIDIKDENGHFVCMDPIKENRFIFLIKMLYRNIFRSTQYNAAFKRAYLFQYKLFKMLGIDKVYYGGSENQKKLTIVGSDEVFNCCQESPWGKTMHLFGKGVSTDYLISYAASFGNTTNEKLYEHQVFDNVADNLKSFNAISVRDNNSYNLITQLTGKKPYKHIDPVFLWDYRGLIPTKVRHKNYILIYGYDGRICEDGFVQSIKEFARKEGKITIAIGMVQKWCDKTIVPDPFELLAYFKYADYIVTDTFHGTVFSIKYQKQFVSIIRESNCQKLGDLLDTFGLQKRAVKDGETLKKTLLEKYDGAMVRSLISEKQTESFAYLHSQIENAEEIECS